MNPKTKLISGLLVVFLAGMVIGSVGTSLYLKDRMGSFYKGGAEKRAEKITGKLTKKLDLTEAQQAQVKTILREDMAGEQAQQLERIKEGIDRRMGRIREILNEGQKTKLEEHRQKLFARLDRRFQER